MDPFVVGLCALSYLAGGIPTGYLLARSLKGIDIREHGSGNPDHPMSDADIRAKLNDAGKGLIEQAALERLATMAESLVDVQDVAEMVELVVPKRA